MKFILFFSLILSSFSLFAGSKCSYRFHPQLAVTMTFDDHLKPTTGTISWDNMNTCTAGMCTQIYPGTFQALYKDMTSPRTVGATVFRVKSIKRTDDLGNRVDPNSEFADFVRTADFVSIVSSELFMSAKWKGREFQMTCSAIE